MSGAKSSSATATTGTVETVPRYRGRFAPTPSGPLHFGSLVAAVASWLDARANRGEWLVRIEDLDPPRERPEAADGILASLEQLGLYWDGPVRYQSTRSEAYCAALDHLRRDGRLRECACPRSALSTLPQNARRNSGDDLYHPPACLLPLPGDASPVALRFRVPDVDVLVDDRAQGRLRVNLMRALGDFVLRRRDGLWAYQLAVVVDDGDQGITDVVRGCDLLTSTPRQLVLQDALGLRRPQYMHVPLAVDGGGLKLSKSSDAPKLAGAGPAAQLVAALRFLGQDPPPDSGCAAVGDVLEWAVARWDPARFAGVASRPAAAYV